MRKLSVGRRGVTPPSLHPASRCHERNRVPQGSGVPIATRGPAGGGAASEQCRNRDFHKAGAPCGPRGPLRRLGYNQATWLYSSSGLDSLGFRENGTEKPEQHISVLKGWQVVHVALIS